MILTSYSTTLLGIFVIMIVSSIGMAVAELPYEKQVKFASAVEQTTGYILAARENIVSGNSEIATLHFTHPIEELYDKLYDNLHTELKNNSVIDQKVEFSLFILKNTDSNIDIDFFDKQTDEIINVLDEAKVTLISEETLNDSVFKLDVISDLLEMSEMEYKAAMDSDNELSKIVDFEDSSAFTMRIESILYTINDMDLDQKNKLELKLQNTQSSMLNKQSFNDVKTQFRNIIDEVIITKKSGLGFQQIDIITDVGFMETPFTIDDSILYEDSSIPSWIKLNAAWWADDLVTNEEFLSGIEYLIEQKILVVSVVQAPIDGVDNKIPSWIKNRTGWWADGMLSDTEFLSGIEYMIERGILVV